LPCAASPRRAARAAALGSFFGSIRGDTLPGGTWAEVIETSVRARPATSEWGHLMAAFSMREAAV